MQDARPLPAHLVQQFQGRRATTCLDNNAWRKRLATAGQNPRAMNLSCCDSLMPVSSIFGTNEGGFFIHRNMAYLVPPHTQRVIERYAIPCPFGCGDRVRIGTSEKGLRH